MLMGYKRLKARLRRFLIWFIEHDLAIVRARLKRLLRREAAPVEMEGWLTHPGNVHAVFLIWQPRETRWYVSNALEALAEAGVNVTLVVNNRLTADRLAELRARSSRLMLRDNSGFDMGGYRDAILSFAEHPPDRLLIMNDSVYYFRGGLADMFRRLATSTCDVCGTYENWAVHHHIQSFCYSISGYMLKQPGYLRFWRRYLPVNSRVWAINKGEVRSSARMMRHARSVEVLFTPAELRKAIRHLDTAELRDLADYLPIHLRPIARSARPLPGMLMSMLVEAIVRESQIHSGGFLYRRFLGAPMLKRDLLFRSQYHLHEIDTLLQTVGAEGHEQEILTDMRIKGIGVQKRGRAKIRYELNL